MRANYKSNDGHLFVLEKSFFYLKKPTLFIRTQPSASCARTRRRVYRSHLFVRAGHDEIESVEFVRLSASSNVKTFDLSFSIKGLPTPHVFSSINK